MTRRTLLVASPEWQHALGYASVEDALFDGRGTTVRCAPTRRTVRLAIDDERVVFAKHRWGRWNDARAEWAAGDELAALGLRGAERILLAADGARSVFVAAAVPGRPLDVILADALRAEPARAPDLVARLAELVGPRVAALHAAGWCYRDLYWNHVFAAVDADGFPVEPVTWIDTERLFRPLPLRFERWRVKDLAGLLSSWPGPLPPLRVQLRFLNACLASARDGSSRRQRRRLLGKLAEKAARIRAHVPRYG